MINSIKEYINSEVAVRTLTQAAFSLTEQKELIKQLMSMVLTNPNLEKCNPQSLLNVAIQIKALGLPMGTDRAYVIPYGNQAQLQIGYKGYIEKALSSGGYKTLNVTDVREGEIGTNNRLTGERGFNWIDNEVERNSKEIAGYVAHFEMNNGFTKQIFMNTQELHNHFVEYSKSYNKNTHKFNGGANLAAMCKKTVIKQLLNKYGVLDSTLARMKTIDSAAFDDEGRADYVDNHDKNKKVYSNNNNINYTKKSDEPIVNERFPQGTSKMTKDQAKGFNTPSQDYINEMVFPPQEDFNGTREEVKPYENQPKLNFDNIQTSEYKPSDKQMWVLKNKGNLTDEEISQMDWKQVSSKIGEINGK